MCLISHLTDLYSIRPQSALLLPPLWSQAGVGTAAETVGQLRLCIFERIGIRKKVKLTKRRKMCVRRGNSRTLLPPLKQC